MRRVLFLTLDLFHSTGGIARFNQRVVRSLEELGGQGLDSVALSLWEPAGRSPRLSAVRVIGCSRRKLQLLVQFVWLLLRFRPGVVAYGHVLLSPLALITKLLRPGARQVLFVHGVEVWYPPSRLIRAGVERLDRIVSVSWFTAEQMRHLFPIHEGRVELLPNAVDSGSPRPATLESQGSTILTVSRLSRADRYKAIDRLLEAMRYVREALPEARLLVVGEGDWRRELEGLAARLGLAGAVTFTGCVPDERLDQLYARADVFCLPSSKEGFGIVFLEAWKNGLPVVAANRGGTVEVVAHERTGLLVDPDSPAQIAIALIDLLRDPGLRRRFASEGWMTVEARYSHSQFREGLRGIIEGLTRSCAASRA